MEKIKIPVHLDKQLIWNIVAGVLILGGVAFLYFGGFLNSDSGEVIPRDSGIKVFCDNYDNLSAQEQAVYEKQAEEIFTKDKLTFEELEMFVDKWDCILVNSQVSATAVPGSCLVLEEQYCDEYEETEFNGHLVQAFQLPEGTPLFAPFDGVFLVEKSLFEGSSFKKVTLTKKDTSSTFVIIGDIRQRLEYADDILEGEWVATASERLGAENGFNVFIYTTSEQNLESL